MNREMGLHYVAMDKPELGHGLVMVQRHQLEGIPGHADVIISTDGRLSIATVSSP